MSGQITGLVAVVMIFSIPLVAIIGGMITSVLKARYKSQQQTSSHVDQEQLARLHQVAKDMEKRIVTLESILDTEVPDWRDEHERA